MYMAHRLIKDLNKKLNKSLTQAQNTLRVASSDTELTVREYLVNEYQNESILPEPKNPFLLAIWIKSFLDKQEYFSINSNGKVERKALIKDFKKYCYENNINCEYKNDLIIEIYKDLYMTQVNSNPEITKKEFFDKLKINKKYKHNWEQ